MLIKGLQKHTLIDYPGKIACTIFLFGCNFRCGYCHNPELVNEQLGRKLRTYPEQEILDFLNNSNDFLEGVCITGGEPTLNQKLPEFIKKIKQLGYHIKLDTNGTNPVMMQNLIKQNLIDYAAMDFKAPLERYPEVAKAEVNIADIEKFVELIRNLADYEFRITVVPSATSKKDLIEIAEYLKQKKANKAFYLQGFLNEKCLNNEFEKIKAYSKGDMNEFLNTIKPYFQLSGIRNENY